MVTVNSPDERIPPDRRPPETYTFVIDQALSGRIVTRRRLEDGKRYDVSVSAVLPTKEPSNGKPTASARLEIAREPVLRRPLSAAIAGLGTAARRVASTLHLGQIVDKVKRWRRKAR